MFKHTLLLQREHTIEQESNLNQRSTETLDQVLLNLT